MPTPALIFLGVILFVFAVLDIIMIVSLIKPGDERKQMMVWKASAYTLLVTVGSLLIDVVVSGIRGQVSSSNSLILLEVTAIVYFISLLYFKKKYGG